MWRILKKEALEPYGFYIEAACESTDTKVEDDMFATGSLCHEVDSGKIYAYNEKGSAEEKWVEQVKLIEE